MNVIYSRDKGIPRDNKSAGGAKSTLPEGSHIHGGAVLSQGGKPVVRAATFNGRENRAKNQFTCCVQNEGQGIICER